MTQDIKEKENAESRDEERIIPLYNLLPSHTRRKVRALKKLQLQSFHLTAKFYHELHKLEGKYLALNGENLARRADIVSGRAEPTPEECRPEEGYESPEESGPEVEEARRRAGLDGARDDKGVPDFWLTALKNAELTAELIRPHDEPVLRHLTDVTVALTEPLGFRLAFHFAPNPYFADPVLVKEYEMKCAPDEDAPWDFDGPEIVRAKGCPIAWNQGMDVTHKTVQKKLKSKGKGQPNTAVKTVRNESFFNFFSPPEAGGGEEAEAALEVDFEVGGFLKERLVPQAVLYYTGEALDEGDTSDSEESDSGEESTDRQSSSASSQGQTPSP